MFRCSTQKLLWPLHFPSCSSIPPETRCVPRRDIWSTMRITALGDTENSPAVAHSLLTYVPFISHYLYRLAIYCVINARTLSSYVFIWKTSAHTDLNIVGLLQYCDDSLSSIMMYMSQLKVIFQTSGTITRHVWRSPHASQTRQHYHCNQDTDGGRNMRIRIEIKKSLRWRSC
jgi:hypothetical protein